MYKLPICSRCGKGFAPLAENTLARGPIDSPAIFILGITVIIFPNLDNCRVNDRTRLFNPNLCFREVIEIPGSGIVNPLLTITVVACLGCPEYHILACLIIPVCFRRPSTSSVVPCYLAFPLVAPVHKVGRLPDHNLLASIFLVLIPALSWVLRPVLF